MQSGIKQNITTEYSPQCGGKQICASGQCVNSFCGDGVCQRSGNSYGQEENYYSCPIDCPGFNFDDIINALFANCFDNNPATVCFWTQGVGSFSIVGNQSLTTSNTLSIPFNFKTAVSYCLPGNNEGGTCFWSTAIGALVIFGIIIFALVIYFVQIPFNKRKPETTFQYVRTSIKRRRRRR